AFVGYILVLKTERPLLDGLQWRRHLEELDIFVVGFTRIERQRKCQYEGWSAVHLSIGRIDQKEFSFVSVSDFRNEAAPNAVNQRSNQNGRHGHTHDFGVSALKRILHKLLLGLTATV